jgi:lipopolysaccharide biosynthesis glycosyltransferase
MFAFLGKIIGSHIRIRSNFNLKFPSAVWKLLVFPILTFFSLFQLNDSITYFDLQAMDQICCQSLNVLKNIESEGVTMETFPDIINFSFTTYSCDGREVELVEGGTDKPVTYNITFNSKNNLSFPGGKIDMSIAD